MCDVVWFVLLRCCAFVAVLSLFGAFVYFVCDLLCDVVVLCVFVFVCVGVFLCVASSCV